MELSQDASKSLTDAIYAQKIALIHAELSESLEALREGDHDNVGEELADMVIRVADLAGGTGVDLQGEIAKKMAKNEGRPRLHGKAF
jgi:NTP pyrophosphatase (non-canonical NTP hydrolase)